VVDLGVRPFNARSLVLSVLLGLPDPRLPVGSLLRLGDAFGIAPGAMRTALSRLVAAGDLTSDSGEYALAGRLLQRKSSQDAGRRPPDAGWDGSWWVVVVTSGPRDVATRRAFRDRMANARMGELRPECWMRPANIAGVDDLVGVAATVAVRGPLTGARPERLVRRLWDLDAIAARCRALRSHLARPPARAADLPAAMTVAAATVRVLRDDPLLPGELTPPGWPVDLLRREYRAFDRALGAALRTAIDR
jgi:phenylacetic acid degradation operon negative regulatory protein